MAQQVKDLALPQLWPRLQLWHVFDPWLWNFHMLQVWPKNLKKKKKKKKREKKRTVFKKGEKGVLIVAQQK